MNKALKIKSVPPIQPNNRMFSHFSNRQRTYVHAVRIFVHKLLPLSKWIRGRKRRRDKIRLSPLCVRLRMVVMALPFMHGLTLGSSWFSTFLCILLLLKQHHNHLEALAGIDENYLVDGVLAAATRPYQRSGPPCSRPRQIQWRTLFIHINKTCRRPEIFFWLFQPYEQWTLRDRPQKRSTDIK